MEIASKSVEKFVVVKIDGNIVLEDTGKLKQHVEPFIENVDVVGIILNCQEVKFIDSSGLGLIVSIFKTLKKTNKKFALTYLTQKAREIFVLTRLDKILTLCDTDEAAMDLLK